MQYRPSDNKPLCDAEIGSVKRGWHGCNRLAVVRTTRRFGIAPPMTLGYCTRHQDRAKNPERIGK